MEKRGWAAWRTQYELAAFEGISMTSGIDPRITLIELGGEADWIPGDLIRSNNQLVTGADCLFGPAESFVAPQSSLQILHVSIKSLVAEFCEGHGPQGQFPAPRFPHSCSTL